MINALIYKIAQHGYIVGSYVNHLRLPDLYEEPEDLDIIVRPEDWPTVYMMLPQRLEFTKLGGIRFKIGKLTIDVWPQTLENFLTTAYSTKGNTIQALDLINQKYYAAGRV